MLWVLDEVLDLVDFISVGTNDLVQYLLAVDRDNVFVSSLYEPFHPAVIRALGAIGDAVRRSGKSACVCGEMAGDEAVAMMLAGMGFDSLSVAPNFLSALKFAVRRTTMADARGLAEAVRAVSTVEEVRALLDGVRERFREEMLEAVSGAAPGDG